MISLKNLPSPITILLLIIVLAAAATWLLPAGQFNKLTVVNGNTFVVTTPTGEEKLPFSQKTLDSLHIKISLAKFANGDIRKPIAIPNTYHQLKSNRQNLLNITEAPLKGISDSIDIILFLLVMAGFMNIFYASGAIEKGLTNLSYRMKGREAWLIISLTFLFSFGGSSYGMAEEALVFYPVMVPLFLAAGYDLLVPVAVIFGGTQLGTLSSFSNPFSTILASNAAGVSFTDGLYERVAMFAVSTLITIWYIVRYAEKVKKNPSASLVYQFDGVVTNNYFNISTQTFTETRLDKKSGFLLILFLVTFLTMIAGVVWFDWWLLEMTALFLVSSIITAFIIRMPEKVFIEKFIKGAEGILSVAFIVGVARGVTIILNDGNISDSILFYSSKLVGTMPPSLFIVVLLVLYMVFTLFISSSSGMAVLTMPIMGSLGIVAGVPEKEIVNAYLFGMGIMGFLTPTGLILPSLALVNISLKTWVKFAWPLLLILTLTCVLFLLVGVNT